MRKDLNLDSLNITVLLTQIEHEFTTVFEDRVFESVKSLDEIVLLLVKDPKIFWKVNKPKIIDDFISALI